MKLQFITHPSLENVKVSVITPVYNVEDYIEETLVSLTCQTLDNLELIMIDDGSSDRSPEIIEAYANKYHNIVFIKQENAGPSVARNRGLEVARGEFISFVDSDDILPLDALETTYKAALKQNADVITGASLSFNSKETWFIGSHLNNGVYRPGEKNFVYNPELVYSLGPCNKLYRKSIIKDLRFPIDIKVTEDQPFVIEALLRANKIYTVDKIIYNYRSREVETNLSLSQSVHVDSTKVLNDIFKSLKISDCLWDKYITNKVARFKIKKSYYHRIVIADIWPAVRSAIVSKNGETQVKSFQLVLDWVKNMDRQLFNELEILHRVMTWEVAKRYMRLKPQAKKLYLQWLSVSFSLFNPGSLHRLETSENKEIFKAVKKSWKRNSTYPILFYKFKSKFEQGNTLIKVAIARRIVFPLASVLPVRKKITFASNKFPGLTDSFKNIYNELINQRPEYEIKGYFKKKKTFQDFCKLYYDVGTSRYLILDDYYRHLYKLKVRKDTDVIQIWHATGAFKKFGHSAVGYLESNPREFEKQAHSFYTKAVVTSKEIIPHYAEAFDMPEESIYPLGLARTDMFFSKDAIEYIRNNYLATYPKLKGKKVITYAPTFRGGPKQRANFMLRLNLNQMMRELGDEYILVLKLHPSVTKGVQIPEEVEKFVLNFSHNPINDVLAITDILISDYSSLIFEYSILERPMIFFAYDLEQYLKDRGFYYEYDQFVPGPIAKETDEIVRIIKENDFDLNQVKAFKERFFDDLDGKASKRFVETLIKP